MSNPSVPAADPDPYGWRAGALRVIKNALLILLAFEVVALTAGTAQILAGATSLSIVELLPRGALFLLVRWLFVLPGLLLVLVGLEFVTRRTGFARAIFLLVALVPMIWWELTQSSGDTSSMSLILGATAVLFAIVARVPDRIPATPPAASDPTPPNPETAVAPR